MIVHVVFFCWVVLHNRLIVAEEQILDPLKIKKLYNKSVKNLSGGELQRVSIAHCLSQEADVYLLDEPSAYLDVEQRATVAKIINDIVELRDCSILVVDHDLLFIDYLSDEIITPFFINSIADC